MPTTTPVQPLVRLLHQMRKTIERLDDATYAMPAPGRTTGGVGGHVRHSLDHISALLGSLRSGVCEYDRRRRGTDVETSRSAAISRLLEVAGALARFDTSLLDDPVLVESQLEPGGAMILTRSSVCRELAFVISHTIHHNALMAQLLHARGVSVDVRFGMAPSTPAREAAATALGATLSQRAQAPMGAEETLSCAR
jgi:hypothetical protein